MPPDAPDLLEREREIDTLRRALDATLLGAGSTIVVRADAGLGKSSLLAAAGDLAQARGTTVLRARAVWLDADIPFGVARKLLAPLVRDPQMRERVFAGDGALAGELFDGGWSGQSEDVAVGVREGLCAIVEAAASGAALTLLIDDLQWADRQSLRFLLTLAGRIDQHAVSVFCARRPGPGSESDALLDALEADPTCTTVRPAPLTPQAVATMVGRTLGRAPELVDACLTATGGNPFYLGELLRELRLAGPEAPSASSVAGTVPASVTRSIAVRLAHLPPEATALARELSILGDDSDVALVARMADMSVAAAESAADALAGVAVLRPGEPLAFTHSLVGAAIYDDQTGFARMRAHRRAAELLMSAGDEAQDDRAAAHLLLARPQDDPVAARVLLRSAIRARVRGESEVAVRLLERALEEEPPAPLEAELLVELAGADLPNGSDRAEQRLARALELIADDPIRQVRTLRAHAAVLQHSGDLAGAAEACRRGLALVPDGHPLAETLQAGFVGAALLWPPLQAEAAAALDEAMATYLDGRPPDAPALCAQVAIHAARTGQPGDVVRDIAGRAFAQDPLVDGDSLGMSLGYAAQALIWADVLDPARELVDAAAESARRRGASMALAVARVNQATIALHQGRLADAVSIGQQALDVYRYGWTNSTWSTSILAEAQLEAGDIEGARSTIELGERAGGARPDHAQLLEARARVALATGDPASALADAMSVIEHLGDAPPRLFRWRTLAAAAAFDLGDHARAAELITVATAELRAGGSARQLGETLTVAGVIAGGADGLTLLDDAVRTLAGSPSRLQYARSLLELGAALRRAGQRAEARVPLARALELADDFGAARLAARATQELHLIGARPRRSALSGLDALTPAERSVVDLAAAGHSNVEIARRLYIARKTVESHLGSSYRKLGITGRAELGELLGAPPQPPR